MSSFLNPEPDPVINVPLAPGGGEAPRQPFAPVRVGLALFVGAALWIGAFFGNNAVLLPARLEQIAPADKVGLLAVLAIAGSVVALLANVFFGALSDVTRSRLGRRGPWMLVGSVGAAAALFVLSTASSAAVIIVVWCVFQLFLNAIAAPLLATLVDRVPKTKRGTYSAIYGLGSVIGAFGSQIFASGFVTNPTTGIAIFAVAALLAGPLAVLIVGEVSSRDLPSEHFSLATIAATFTFPRRGARDFYFALTGKLLFVLGYFAILGYQFYILTDYIKLPIPEAGALIATLGLISLLTALVFGFIAGPISDRIGRRKVLVIGSAIVVAAATLVPFFSATPIAMIVYAVLSGIGNGVYNSVDQALNTEVLPSPDNAAKDLGILNMANTGGQIIGPGLTSAVVALAGGYGPVFLVATVIIVAGGLLIVPIRSVR